MEGRKEGRKKGSRERENERRKEEIGRKARGSYNSCSLERHSGRMCSRVNGQAKRRNAAAVDNARHPGAPCQTTSGPPPTIEQ